MKRSAISAFSLHRCVGWSYPSCSKRREEWQSYVADLSKNTQVSFANLGHPHFLDDLLQMPPVVAYEETDGGYSGCSGLYAGMGVLGGDST